MTKLLVAVGLACGLSAPAFAQQAGGDAAMLAETIAALGSFDFTTRRDAARTIRRLPIEITTPALDRATRSHADEYVRFRALVLLSGIDTPEVAALMRDVMGDRNDRLRTLAFQWLEHHPDPNVLPRMIAALPSELSEFVRPALTRAIAAHADDPRARATILPLVTRGEDFFRGVVIDALGEHKGTYALAQIIEVAKLEGPLQDDAITALGKIGDPSVRPVLAELQGTGPAEVQPTVSASLCLIKIDCQERLAYLKRTLVFAEGREGYQPLLRGVVHALGVLAVQGHADALSSLLDAGVPARDPARAAIALGVGLVALRNPSQFITLLETRTDRDAVLTLLVEAFDMLSEDYEEERFYLQARQLLWSTPEGSAKRVLAEQLIERLEF